MKIGKMYSLGQSPKIAARAVEWRRVLSQARRIGAYREAACGEEARNEAAHAHLQGVRGRTHERTTRLARSLSPIIVRIIG